MKTKTKIISIAAILVISFLYVNQIISDSLFRKISGGFILGVTFLLLIFDNSSTNTKENKEAYT